MLLTRNVPEHDHYRNTFRKYATEHSKYQQRVQYTYVYADTQTQFVNKLTHGSGVENDTSLKVRKDENQESNHLFDDVEMNKKNR